MGCTSCSPEGCGNKGHCANGSCNKMNTFDWISTLDLADPNEYQYVEVSFKNGARKEFYKNDPSVGALTGDLVVVQCKPGFDIGKISLSGELVRAQMKKKKTHEGRVEGSVVRKANERDIERLNGVRQIEKEVMVRARVISRTMGLDMKVGDVEYQGDGKKATFFYTANGRVDFRELVRAYAKEFKVKIEMRQIGSRQESARIGGIGSCGRELCCSTWLSDFKSVNTAAARYQNIAINQTKLSGQCGRLKCCLNYELDSYMDALQHFPKKADVLRTKKGRAKLMKTDIFKGIMYYCYDDIAMRGVFHPIDKERVKEILAMNKKGEFPDDLNIYVPESLSKAQEEEIKNEELTGIIELPDVKKKRGSKNSRRKNKPRGNRNKNQDKTEGGGNSKSGKRKPRPQGNQSDSSKEGAAPKDGAKTPNQGGNKGRKPNNRNKKRGPRNSGPKPNQGENKSDN